MEGERVRPVITFWKKRLPMSVKYRWLHVSLSTGIFISTGLLVWVWVTDQPSSAYPQGRFYDLRLLLLFAICATSGLPGLWFMRKMLGSSAESVG